MENINYNFQAEISNELQALLQILNEKGYIKQKNEIQRIVEIENIKDSEKSKLLDILSYLLLQPDLTFEILHLFRCIAIELVARWIIKLENEPYCSQQQNDSERPPKRNSNGDQIEPEHLMDIDEIEGTHDKLLYNENEKYILAFSKILITLPQVKSFALYILSVIDVTKELTQLIKLFQNNLDDSLDKIKEVLCSLYRITYQIPYYELKNLWDSSILYSFLEIQNNEIQVYTIFILSKYLNLSNVEQDKLIAKYLSPATSNQDILKMEPDLSKLIWLKETELNTKEQATMFMKNNKSTKVSSNSPFTIESHNLCKIITDICGVLLPNLSSLTPVNKSVQLNESRHSTIAEDRLILTPTTRNNLHSIAFALSIGSPILLEGVSGSGKTCLVEEMARLTNHEDLITIHLGDQTDSKVLLGTYVCTNIPGQFRWQPGVLTTAVTEGRWILIEDINLAPLEVISVLIPLLQTRTLFIPSRGEKIKAADGFQIFATQTLQVSSNGILTKKSNDSISENLWTQVRVQHLSLDEIRQVLTQKYPSLLRIIPAIVNTTDVIINHWKEIMLSSHIGNRLLSLRDIMKWAFRINQLIQLDHDTGNYTVDQDTIQKIFLEAADCFTAMIPQPEARMKILTIIGEKLNLSPHSIEYIVNNYNPELKEEPNTVTIGRVNLPAHQYHKEKQLSSKGASKSIFAHTVHSLRTLEKIAVSTYLKESVLLVGETGAGKTTIVQYLAELLGQKLVVVNLSQQSESSDLLGGFKPVDVHLLVSIIQEKFIQLFSDTFPTKSNKAFIDSVKKVISRKKWEKLIVAYRNAIQMSKKLFKKRQEKNAKNSTSEDNTRNKKMKKSDSQANLEKAWKQFEKDVDEFELQYEQIKGNFLFSFIEGSLVKAIQQGYWILLDEINLASSETLESLSGLLQGAEGSIILTERGDTHPIKRHPNFRIFGCMNPATDVGKKDLPPGLRSRFTEFYVDSLDIYKEDLTQVVHRYLEKFVGSDQTISQQIVEFYFEVKKASKMNLYDGANHRPHFSMRTLTRSLSYATQIAPVYGLKRSLYEGIVMTFLTQLDAKSASYVDALAKKYILANMKTNEINTFLKQIPKCPSSDSSKYDLFQSFWLEKGEFESPEDDDYIKKYIITPSVENNMKNLARAIYSRKFPVLIQGPTSSGKTSMVEYIARRTHHRFVRINNHEHTDLQEYLGMYVSDSSGQLVFQEGVLVEALRKGYWIVLDELNLAPTDVLEALNRLLDDNRELLINETQEVVKPHPHFMLFATQNPSGLYGGRKVLSRAFKNRFLELNFDDFPENELEQILEQRCQIPPSYCKKLVIVYKELQQVRQKTRMFEGRHSFITLRDLFRWAERHAMGYQELAQDGFMILGERIRKESEKAVVKQIIEKTMKVKLVEEKIYDCESIPDFTNCIKTIENPSDPLVSDEAIQEFKKVVWNKAMKRLFTLVSKCIQHQEPVLLVGETGCGKTTVCQVLAAIRNQKLHIVNCHQHTETSDFLGDQRPHRDKERNMAKAKNEMINFLTGHFTEEYQSEVLHGMEFMDVLKLFESKTKKSAFTDDETLQEISRIKGDISKARTLFEWKDGPLISAMKQGDMFLLDEISLADDSVLERLNSVLEPKRQLVLAEKGGKNVEEIVANKNFLFLATMNPGGDYGKKELSPALRNRFTEIWVPQIVDDDDLLQIMNQNLTTEAIQPFGKQILSFVHWFSNEVNKGRTIFSLRDILSWINFINLTHEIITPEIAFLHGGSMVFLDGLGINPMLGVSTTGLDDGKFRKSCEKKLASFAYINDQSPKKDLSHALEITNADIINNDEIFGIYPFTIPKGKYPSQQVKFDFKAPTTLKNTMRVLRALQLKKPILLEGSPGVGKTSLISNLASVSGRKLVRINLSEQTDLMDLFGSDLPVEGGSSGEFSWRDGLFLKAMQEGDWVLLDELNLASQSVLEGLNACLDHRATVYIPELDKTFSCSPEFRVFGAQNPQQQGGGRKGLPKSFLNRFTQVYVDQLGMTDLLCISQSLYPDIEKDLIEKMIKFNCRMHEDTMINYIFGRKGAPWEFNLRDVFRWIDLTRSCPFSRAFDPTEYIDMVYIQRMRTHEDREYVKKLYKEIFGEDYPQKPNPNINISSEFVQIGHSTLPRQPHNRFDFQSNNYELLTTFLKPLESLMKCVELNWMAILTGATATGKTSMVRLLANLTGNELFEFSMNSGVDTMELLGGFEQFDINRHVSHLLEKIKSFVASLIKSEILKEDSSYSLNLLSEVSKAFHSIETTALADVVKSDTIGQFLKQLQDLLDKHQSAEFMGEFTKIQNLYQNIVKLQDENVRGSFEWIDGILLQALENGDWLLIDNANYCNPSVLDRLNGLLEPNGLLFVNERGLVNGEVKTVRPHPNFRIFLTVDPKNGEISRAMRNRGVEIALIDALSIEESNSDIEEDKSMNMVKLFNSFGIPGQDLPHLFSKLHQDIKSKSTFGNINPYKLILCGKLFIERVQRGQDYVEATKETINLLYLDQLNMSLDQVQIDVPVYDNYTSILAPLSWPYFVSGDFIKSSSSLAMVCYHGSYLYFVLKCLDEKKTDFFGNIDPMKVMDATFRYFVLNSSLKDWTYRVEWLKYIYNILNDNALKRSVKDIINIFIALFGSSFMQLYVISLSNISRQLHIPKEVILLQGISLENYNPYLFKQIEGEIKRSNFEELDNSWIIFKEAPKALDILYQLEQKKIHSDLIYKRAASIKINQLSIIQQSYGYSQGRILESQLSHPIIKYFYELFSILNDLISNFINENMVNGDIRLFEDIMTNYNNLWDNVQEKELDYNLVYIILTKLVTLLNDIPIIMLSDPLSQLVENIKKELNLSSIHSNSLYWKNSGVLMLQSNDLFKVEKTFRTLNEMVNISSAKFNEWINHPYIYTNPEIRQSLSEGMATLYYLNKKNNQNESIHELFNLMKELPGKLEEKIKMNIKEIEDFKTSILNGVNDDIDQTLLDTEPLSLLVKQNERLRGSDIWSLMDYQSLLNEMNFIYQTIKIFDNVKSKKSIPKYEAEGYVKVIKSLNQFMIQSTSRPPLDSWQYIYLGWLVNTNELENGELSFNEKLIDGIINESILKWHERLWNNVFQTCINSNHEGLTEKLLLDGSSYLYTSLQTYFVSTILQNSINCSAYEYKNLIEKVSRMEEYFKAEQQKFTRTSNEIAQIIYTIRSVIVTYQSSFQEEDYVQILALLNHLFNISIENKTVRGTTIQDLLTLLGKSSDEVFQMLYAKYIVSILDRLKKIDDPMEMGQAWITTGLLLVMVIIPKFPVDPAAEVIVEKFLLEQLIHYYETEIYAQKEIEKINKGDSQSLIIKKLQEKLTSTKAKLSELLLKVPLRPKKTMILSIFQDLEQLSKTFLNELQLFEIVHNLSSDDKETYLQRESLLQSNLYNFIERMQTNYPKYMDLLKPVFIAIYQVKYGLKLISSTVNHDINDRDVDIIVNNLMNFGKCDIWTQSIPSSLTQLDQLKRNLKVKKNLEDEKIDLYIELLNVFITRLNHQVKITGVTAPYYEQINLIYMELSRIITLIEEKEREKIKEEEELYKYKTKDNDVMVDKDEEEEEFNELFPDYYEDFDDVTSKALDDGSKKPSKEPKESKKSLLSKTRLGRIEEIASKIVESQKSFMLQNYSDEVSDGFNAFINSYTMAGKIIKETSPYLSENIDNTCYHGNLVMIHEIKKRVNGDNQQKNYNFYKDENIMEVSKAIPILVEMENKLHELLQRWPGHSVLLQLSTICKRIALFPVTSPVIKILTGLEILIQKCDEWEAYASKEVSIKAEMNKVIELIVEWRKYELKLWWDLLEVQDKEYAEKASKLWFYLYKIILEPINKCSEITVEISLDDYEEMYTGILNGVDQFIRNSSLGEFSSRLQMIYQFYIQITKYHKSSNMTITISNILWNIHQYYSQFSDTINEFLKTSRKPIEKELKNYVKIAKWKDVNIYALKESAKRTHYQLNKFIKKYKEILNTSIYNKILETQNKYASNQEPKINTSLGTYSSARDYFDSAKGKLVPNMEISNEKLILKIEKEIENKERLSQVPLILKKMKSISKEFLRKGLYTNKADIIEELCEAIIERLKEFKKQNDTLSDDAKDEKAWKLQKSLRKKALSDLFGQFKKMGIRLRSVKHFDNQKKTDYIFKLNHTVDESFSLIRPSAAKSGLFKQIENMVKQSNDRYYKFIAYISLLRSLAHEASPDLSELDVQRSMSSEEHMLYMILQQRTVLASLNENYSKFLYLYHQMQDIYRLAQSSSSTSDILLCNDTFIETLKEQKFLIDEIYDYVQQISYIQHIRREDGQKVVVILEKIKKCKKITDKFYHSLITEAEQYQVSTPLKNCELQSLFNNNFTVFNEISQDIKSFSAVSPSSLIADLAEKLEKASQKLEMAPIKLEDNVNIDTVKVNDIVNNINQIIESIMVSFQNVKANLKEQENEASQENMDEDEFEDVRVNEVNKNLLNSKETLKIEKIIDSTLQLFNLINELPCEKLIREFVLQQVQTLFVIYDHYNAVVQQQIYEYICFHRVFIKFSLINCKLFISLYKSGLSIPKIYSGEEEIMEDNVAGTGIGEGQGNKNVSDEIENEDQIEGTQDEQTQQPQDNENKDKDDNAIEMNEDFEGKLEDVERQPGDEDEEEEEDEDGEEEELEEQMGDIDEDQSNVVDEKMWNDEEDENVDENEKTEKDSEAKGENSQEEMVAKNDDEPEQAKDDDQDTKEKNKDKKEEKQEQNNDEDQKEEINNYDEDMFEENNNIDIKSMENPLKEEEEQEEEEDMELPDDLNLDGGEEDDSKPQDMDVDDKDEDQDSMDVDEEVQENDDQVMEKEIPQEFQELPDDNVEGDEEIDEDNNNSEEQEGEGEEGGEEEEGQDENQEENSEDMEEDMENNIAVKDENEEETAKEENTVDENNENENEATMDNTEVKKQQSENQYGVQDEFGNDNNEDNDLENIDDNNAAASQQEFGNDNSNNDMATTTSSMQNMTLEEPKKRQPREINPNRSLGDSLREWKKRLKSIVEPEEEEEEKKDAPVNENNEKVNEDNTFEYLKEDDEAYDLQTLGIATEDQLEKQEKKAAIDEEQEAEENDEDAVANQEEEEEENEDDEMRDDTKKFNNEKNSFNKIAELHQHEEEEEDESSSEVKKEVKTEKANENSEEPEYDLNNENVTKMEDNNNEEEEEEEEYSDIDVDREPEKDYEELREELEKRMVEWRANKEDMDKAHQLWKDYELLTFDLSMELCEQLRLILEPTLATKLKGDYRNGKRLNMKKIIPYIASQFKKDKIWLRRTKPSKRQYQIMLSVDDSKSMSESHSVQLTFEALAMISKALTQLEAGELAVVRFGETVNLVHPFESPFNDESGAQAIRQFTFEQQSTDIQQLMTSTLGILEEARERSSSHNESLWQLQIILSDGICENHEQIKSLVHSAMEKQIMVVFVVIDTKQQILGMNNVIKQPGKGFKLERYISTFPFDNYVILSDINQLPEILSETLRQYFMMVQHD